MKILSKKSSTITIRTGKFLRPTVNIRFHEVRSRELNIIIIIMITIILINALAVQIPRHNTILLLTLDTLCYSVGTHKHDRHLELYYAYDTTLNKETTHSKAVMNLKNLLRFLYNNSRMKQVLMLRYKSTKCSKHYKYIKGKKTIAIYLLFLSILFQKRYKSKITFINRS